MPKQKKQKRLLQKRSALILLIGIVALIICGVFIGYKARFGSYAHKNACDILTLDDAQSLVDQKLKIDNRLDDKVTNLAGYNHVQSMCSYVLTPLASGARLSYADSKNRGDVSLGISEYDVHNSKSEQLFLENFDQKLSSAGTQRVDGPWDAAFYSSDDGTLHIRKRNYIINIVYSDFNLETLKTTYSKDAAINAGKAAVEGLSTF